MGGAGVREVQQPTCAARGNRMVLARLHAEKVSVPSGHEISPQAFTSCSALYLMHDKGHYYALEICGRDWYLGSPAIYGNMLPIAFNCQVKTYPVAV
jgi:hypothetical protein